MGKLLVVLLILSVTHVSNAEEVMYCVEDVVTGFTSNNGQLESVDFKPARFTVKVLRDFESVIIDDFTFQCSSPFPTTARSAYKLCNHYGGDSFRFITTNRKFIFIKSSSFGYLFGNDDDGISAGTCETF